MNVSSPSFLVKALFTTIFTFVFSLKWSVTFIKLNASVNEVGSGVVITISSSLAEINASISLLTPAPVSNNK